MFRKTQTMEHRSVTMYRVACWRLKWRSSHYRKISLPLATDSTSVGKLFCGSENSSTSNGSIPHNQLVERADRGRIIAAA